MKQLTLLMVLFEISACFSQDYLPIQPGRTYFFGKNNIVSIDSTHEQLPGYEMHYMAPGLQLCLELGLDLSHFSFRDSLLLHKKNEAELWVLSPSIAPYQIPYQLSDGDTAYCTMLEDVQIFWVSEGVEVDTFLGTIDSVRTLRMICQDSSGAIIPNHYLHGKQLRISKLHGALNWFGASGMNVALGLTPEPEIFNLSGISNPNLGFSGYTMSDIYDFYPGDEVHRKAEANAYVSIYKYFEKWVCLRRDTISNGQLLRLIREHSIRYYSWEHYYGRDPHWQPVWIFRDTLTIPLQGTPYLPHQVEGDNNQGNWTNHYGTYISTPKLPGVKRIEIEKNPSFWCENQLNDVVFENFCFLGLGCYGFSWSGYAISSSDDIVYYHKGSSTWGNPLPDSVFSNAVSITAQLDQPHIKVYPNPSSGKIILEGIDPMTPLEVTDIHGKLIWTGEYHHQVLDLTELSAGLYLIRLPSHNQVLKWRKE